MVCPLLQVGPGIVFLLPGAGQAKEKAGVGEALQAVKGIFSRQQT